MYKQCSTQAFSSRSGLRNRIIPLYLHNPGLLKAGESPSDPKISMLSPSLSLLSFRKTGSCADVWTHFPSAAEMLIRKHHAASVLSHRLAWHVFKSLSCALFCGDEVACEWLWTPSSACLFLERVEKIWKLKTANIRHLSGIEPTVRRAIKAYFIINLTAKT